MDQLCAEIVMSAAGNIEPQEYTLVYRHGVDEKRRLQIPAKWRPDDPTTQFALILWPNGDQPEACLLVLPPAEWRALVDKLKAMPFADHKTQVLRRYIGTNACRVSLDRSGRICIPEDLAKRAAIENEAILVGLVDRFQIWNPERHRLVKAEDAQSSSDAFRLLS